GVGNEAPGRERVIDVEEGIAVGIHSVRHEDRDVVIGENTSARRLRWDRANLGGTRVVAKSLVAPEVKRLVTPDLASCGGAKLVSSKRSLRVTLNVVKEIFRIEGVVAEKIIRRAVKAVGAGLRCGIDLGSATAELRRI